MLIKTSIAAAFLLSAAAPALAGQRDESVSQMVSVADLDLATPEGVRALDNRIGRTIRRLCHNPSEYNSIAGVMGFGPARQCRREALAAIADRRSALLAASSAPSRRLAARAH